MFIKKIKKIKRILIVPLAIILCFTLYSMYKKEKLISTVRAFGDLIVNFKSVLPGEALFKVVNMLPGDMEMHDVDVTNNGSLVRRVVVRGIKVGPFGQTNPKLETILDITIIENGTKVVYSNKLQKFFMDSMSYDGVFLGLLNAGESKNYNFRVTFPEGAGNIFQKKSVIFDLTFGRQCANHIVINEVFCNVDNHHGLDSYKDRGYPKNDRKRGNNDEWIELYNPTEFNISLKNWTLEDNSGKKITIHANKIIKAGGFALISKDASIWKYWKERKRVTKITSLDFLGDGLDNFGDFLILRDSYGREVDFVSWGGFTPGWNLSPFAGWSIERVVPGFDTDNSIDWHTINVPNP